MVERIKDLCEARGLTLAALERELGFGNGTIARWDVCRPNVDRVVAVAKYFEKPIEYFVNIEGK